MQQTWGWTRREKPVAAGGGAERQQGSGTGAGWLGDRTPWAPDRTKACVLGCDQQGLHSERPQVSGLVSGGPRYPRPSCCQESRPESLGTAAQGHGVTLGVLCCPLLGWARLSHSVGLHVASSDGLTRKALRLHAGHWGPQGPLKVIQKAGRSPGPPQPCRHHSNTVCTYPTAHPWPWL